MSANTATVEGTTRGTLLVVDGHSLAFRAFFALPVENFSTSAGQATNAVWGFATMLSQVIDVEHPDHLAVAFDVKGGTFRNTMLPQYKGTRDAAPEDLLTQLPLIQRMLTALGVTFIEKPGYEGDDVIGTLASMGDKAGYRTLVLSGDRDAFQLINDTSQCCIRGIIQRFEAYDSRRGGGEIPRHAGAISGSCCASWRNRRQHPRRSRRGRWIRGQMDQPVWRT